MISKHIIHYFNANAHEFFQVWLQQLKQASLTTPGFNNILVGKAKDDDSTTVHLILQFADEQGLQNWNDNPVHIDLLAALQPYLVRPSDIQLFEFKVL